MTKEATAILIVSYSLSGALVYSGTYGLSTFVRRILTAVPVAGIVFFILTGRNPVDDSLNFGMITGPLVIGLLYELFDVISRRRYNRPFLLHASGSKDMKGMGLRRDNAHYRWTDILFSLILILMWIGWPMLFVITVHFVTQ